MKVLVTGASGFIGRRLVNRLYSSASSEPSPSNKLRITCITRSLGPLKSRFPENVDMVKADVMNYPELVKAMTGIDIAYYLIHSMEGSSKDWKKFAQEIGWEQKISQEPHILWNQENNILRRAEH